MRKGEGQRERKVDWKVIKNNMLKLYPGNDSQITIRMDWMYMERSRKRGTLIAKEEKRNKHEIVTKESNRKGGPKAK